MGLYYIEPEALREMVEARARQGWPLVLHGNGDAAIDSILDAMEAAIRAVTSNAAWQCHSDHEIGSLEPGKLADLVVLDADPRTVEPTAISDIGVSETWMDGRRVFGG